MSRNSYLKFGFQVFDHDTAHDPPHTTTIKAEDAFLAPGTPLGLTGAGFQICCTLSLNLHRSWQLFTVELPLQRSHLFCATPGYSFHRFISFTDSGSTWFKIGSGWQEIGIFDSTSASAQLDGATWSCVHLRMCTARWATQLYYSHPCTPHAHPLIEPALGSLASTVPTITFTASKALLI